MYQPSPARYDNPSFYRRCGKSGIQLPLLSLGLWHNFGGADNFENSRAIARRAFDLGITHFDLANNYGPPYGSAEETFGKLLQMDFAPFRDELILSTKAGYDMWPGPYGNWGSRKYLLASLDQSLHRMKLDYVDIFYHHRPDLETPLEETAGALAQAVKSGKALYAAISNYPPEQTSRMAAILRELKTPCLIHQPKYSMFERTPERGLFDTLLKEGIGSIVFSPLAQGLLTNRYLSGIPADARAARDPRFLKPDHITEKRLAVIRALNEIAQQRGQSLAQMALVWVLRQPAVTTALIGASRPEQVAENVAATKNLKFDPSELSQIEKILAI
ncbi:MAG TPA: L-glyceraldehyde 3-phosphate reductase [Verrucomicrobiae bacterium]|nr:L-glyceraldehyde 3-phosphate reductase [Verrucomicrobiae bacterium]